MCLAVPGKVVEIEEKENGIKVGRVQFGDVTRTVLLSLVPDVRVGDYVMFESGLATSIIDPNEANEINGFLKELEQLAQ